MKKTFLNLLFALSIVAIGLLLPTAYRVHEYKRMKSITLFILLKDGYATGFYIKMPNGTPAVLTNKHVCEHSDGGTVILSDAGSIFFGGTVIKVDPNEDLCLIQPSLIISKELMEIKPRTISSMDYVVAYGFPQGEAFQSMEGVILDRRVAHECEADKKNCQDQESYLATILAAPGASGSPVINIFGNLVGIVFGISAETHHTYMIPVEKIQNFIER